MNTQILKRDYAVIAEPTKLHFLRGGQVFFMLPAVVSVSGEHSGLTLTEANENRILYRGENAGKVVLTVE